MFFLQKIARVPPEFGSLGLLLPSITVKNYPLYKFDSAPYTVLKFSQIFFKLFLELLVFKSKTKDVMEL